MKMHKGNFLKSKSYVSRIFTSVFSSCLLEHNFTLCNVHDITCSVYVFTFVYKWQRPFKIVIYQLKNRKRCQINKKISGSDIPNWATTVLEKIREPKGVINSALFFNFTALFSSESGSFQVFKWIGDRIGYNFTYMISLCLTCGSCGVETRNRTQLQQQQHFAYQGLTCKKYDVTYSSNFPRVELNSLFDIKFYNLISGDGHSENYFVRTYFCLMCFLIDWTILHRFSEACSSNSLAKVVFGIDISILTMMKIALPAMTAVSEKTLVMAYMKQDSLRTETSTSEHDLLQEQRIKSTIREKMINSFFLSSDNFMNISTGETTQSVELIDARQRGLDALEKTEESKAKKVDPVKLKTFVEKTKKQPAQQQTKELYMEERAVIRDLCFAEQLGQKEKIDAVSHEWNKYLSSIFIPDVLHPAGFAMRKGNKSDYGTMLKTTMALQWNEPEELPASDMKTSYFIDFMAFIQRYQDLGSVTFQELSRIYLQKILSIIPQHYDIVHVVGDRYDLNQETSLKIEETWRRQKRSKKAKSFITHDYR
ncbi:hypothetical protein GQR58_019681 [Nymphon striatum]|nr:hypothetical protein GQR58_019681 [Nymphon striatum]